jgi:hypothetical protein
MLKNAYKKFLFVLVFVALGFLAMQVPFSKLVGAENIRFSLFDFYGPVAGAFIGSFWGILVVIAMQLSNWAFHGFQTDAGTIIRFFPALFAVLYFARKNAWSLFAPGLAMLAFWAHPEGRQAWYFALYWTIPFIMHFLRDRFIFARALGATFTQHSVGGVLWIWAFNMKAEMWAGLIPVVWMERGLMALGIALTYIALNYLMSIVINKAGVSLPFIKLNPKYSFLAGK